VLENFSSQTILEKWCLAKISQTCASLGALDCYVCTEECLVPRLPAGEQAALVKSLRHRGYNSSDCPVCTGLFGVPVAHLANGRPRNPRGPHQPGQRSPGCIGLSSVSSDQRLATDDSTD
jgi:hypothetical protein